MTPDFLKRKFDEGLEYNDYVATGNPGQQAGWVGIDARVVLTEAQRALLGSFTRQINVLVVSGIWCGDCVRQGPMVQRLADAVPGKRCQVRWLDRDAHKDLQQQVRICGGDRVPVAIFMAEDFELVSWAGDKLLSRYRSMARSALGPSCPLPGAPVPQDELEAELQDWLDEFERVHLILRLSARLRAKHGD